MSGVGSGVISGGWGFVWAAYTLTTVAFLIYGISLMARLRYEHKSDSH